MPTVPRYQRQVSPQQRPSGALRAVETPESSGVLQAQARGQVARAGVEFGGAIQDVASKFLNIRYSTQAKALQESVDYADQLAVLGASNKLATWERTLYADGGAFTLQGEQAFGLPEKVNADFEKTADEIESSLSTPNQKLAFAKLRSSHGQSVALDVERHVSSEMKQFAVTELNAAKKNTGDAAILKGGAGDFKRAGDEMAAFETSVRAVGPKLGMGPQQIEDEIRGYRSAVHVGIIEQLVADEHVDLARIYFEEVTGRTMDGKAVAPGQDGEQSTQYPDLPRAGQQPAGGQAAPTQKRSEIEGEHLDEVTKLLKEGSTKKQAQQASDKILSEGGTLTEQRAKAKAIENPEVRDATLSYIEHEAVVNDAAERDAKEARSRSVYDIIDKTKSVRSIPPAAWSAMSGAERSAARSYAKSLVEGNDAVTDLKTYYGLVQEALDDPGTFSRLNLYDMARSRLSKSDFEQFSTLQLSIRRAEQNKVEDTLSGYSTFTQMFEATAKSRGIEPNTPEALELRRKFELTAEAEARARGKKLANTEIQQILDRLVMDATTKQGSWWALINPWSYDLSNQTKKGMEVTIDDIPQDQRRLITDALRKAGQPMTPDAVLDLYLRQLQKQPK